jgi:small subunit ribosomal protein S3
MGQKVRPIGFRTGITTGWLSNWSASKTTFAERLVEDQRIRQLIKDRCRAGISRICIDRTAETVSVTIHAASLTPLTAGQGAGIEGLTEALQSLCRRPVEVLAVAVSCPELDAQLVAERIVEQLQHQRGFRRPVRRAVEAAVQAGARGIKVQLAGRLLGAEVARTVRVRSGSLPLATLRARIDHGRACAQTPEGSIGVQVWINNGEIAA